jgi:hypothetical protein
VGDFPPIAVNPKPGHERVFDQPGECPKVFRREAVRLVLRSIKSTAEVSQEVGPRCLNGSETRREVSFAVGDLRGADDPDDAVKAGCDEVGKG